jgi:NAD(P)H-hydrate epimerase
MQPPQNLNQLLRNKVLTTAESRAIDVRAIEFYGMNSLVLMENAASNCARWLIQKFPQSVKTVILCGSGNNGGDGLVLCRHLRTSGWDCHCYLLGPMHKLSADASHNAKILLAGGHSAVTVADGDSLIHIQQALSQSQLVIDAMLGTGARGNPRDPLAQWIEAANQCSAAKLAIDIPTGIDADSGACAPTFFRTDITLTFVALKPSMVLPDAPSLFGEIEVLPIGIPENHIRELLQPSSQQA